MELPSPRLFCNSLKVYHFVLCCLGLIKGCGGGQCHGHYHTRPHPQLTDSWVQHTVRVKAKNQVMLFRIRTHILAQYLIKARGSILGHRFERSSHEVLTFINLSLSLGQSFTYSLSTCSADGVFFRPSYLRLREG